MTKPIIVCTREDEYETQLYGFCQKDLIEHFKSSLHEQILSSAKGLKNTLLEAQTTDEGRQAVELAIGSLIEKCLECCTGPIERLTEQLRTFFGLPPHILLPEDKVQRNRYIQEDEEKEKRELSNVKSRFRRAQFLKAMYKEELKKASQVVTYTKSFYDTLTHLENPDVWANSIKSNQIHKMAQGVLGLEVIEASIKLLDELPCAENPITMEDAIFTTYNSL